MIIDYNPFSFHSRVHHWMKFFSPLIAQKSIDCISIWQSRRGGARALGTDP